MPQAQSSPLLLPPEKQHQWLVEHIPHRIRATVLGLPMRRPWTLPPVPTFGFTDEQHISLWCLANSNWEGRLTAMRWLIMFVGISGNDSTQTKGVPKLPNLHANGTDVRIDMFDGGFLFTIPSAGAEKLAKVWKGCSQATSHPTQDSNHPEVDEASLAEALHLVIDHLQETIYAKANRHVFEDTVTLNALGAPKLKRTQQPKAEPV